MHQDERIHSYFQTRKCKLESFTRANATMDETTKGMVDGIAAQIKFISGPDSSLMMPMFVHHDKMVSIGPFGEILETFLLPAFK